MSIRKLTIGLAAAALLTLPGLGGAPAAAREPGPGAQSAPFVKGEVLVAFKGSPERVVDLPSTIGVAEATRALNSNPAVAYAVPNYIARAAAVPNDPGRAGVAGGWREMQWNFLPCGSLCGQSSTPLSYESRGGIDALGAWNILRRRRRHPGRGVTVAVLDTGIAYRGKKPAFRKSPDFSRWQFLPGYDFVRHNAMPLDRDGHGTHVAGTIAERTDNGVALTGLAPYARLIPVRVLDNTGFGTAHDIARGVRFAARHGADIINMSFEFDPSVDSCTQIRGLCRALRFATKWRGIVAVAAAGNEHAQPVAYPAKIPRVIGVGRTTRDGCVAAGSRYGHGLDLVAPGGGAPLVADCGNDLVPDSSDPIFQLTFSGSNYKDFGYPSIYDGTSMAAAHVSGLAAMVISSGVLGRNPSRAAVQCQLEATARNSSAELGQAYKQSLFGAGLVDAAAAVSTRAPGC